MFFSGEVMKIDQSSKKNRVIPFVPDGEYYFQRGIIAYQKGELLRAKKFIGRAIVFNPDDSEFLCQQAAILAELEEYEASNQLLKRVVYELDEGMTECYFFMANNLAHLGRYEEAIQEIKRYISYDPNGSFIEEARELYKILLSESEDPFFTEEAYIVDHEKGRQALEHGEYWEAIAYFKKVIDSQPAYWAAYNNLAIAYFSLGKSKLAFDTIEKVLEFDPGNIHALCNRVTFYYQLGQRDRVDIYYPLLLNLYPLYPEHRSKLGSTFFFLGDYESAYHWLKSAEIAGVWDQSFYYWLALSAYRIGNVKQAMRAWEQVDFFSETPFQPFEYGKIQEMLMADDAKDNPLVFSLLQQQLKEGEPASKALSLFLLSYYKTNEAIALIETIADKRSETKTIRMIAQMLLQKHKNEGTSDNRLKVMLYLEQHLGNGFPLIDQHDLYQLWMNMFQSNVEMDDDSAIQACAAALEYMWKKGQDKAISQAEVASKYHTTLYRVRKVLNNLERSTN